MFHGILTVTSLPQILQLTIFMGDSRFRVFDVFRVELDAHPLPAQLLGDRLIASFCPTIMAEQTEGMDDDEATNWLAYWITRMFIRLTKQNILSEVSGDLPDEKILEEMVEDQIRAEAGLQDESS